MISRQEDTTFTGRTGRRVLFSPLFALLFWFLTGLSYDRFLTAGVIKWRCKLHSCSELCVIWERCSFVFYLSVSVPGNSRPSVVTFFSLPPNLCVVRLLRPQPVCAERERTSHVHLVLFKYSPAHWGERYWHKISVAVTCNFISRPEKQAVGFVPP